MSLYSRNLKCLRVQSSTAHTCTLSVDELYSMVILFNTSKCSLDCSSDISSTLGTTVFKVCSNAVTMTSLSSWPCTVKCTDILLLQLARTMIFLHSSHFTSKLAEACKSFLEQCTQRGYCWTFSTVFMKRTNNDNLCSCGSSWRLFHGYVLDLVILNGRDDGIGHVVNFLASFQKHTRMFVIL